LYHHSLWYSVRVESGLVRSPPAHCTRGCGDTIGPPHDEQRAARNMLRIVV